MESTLKQKHYTMKELPTSERPYEKFYLNGVKSLSDAELLAIILKNGTANHNCIDMARDLLSAHPIYDGLLGLYHLSSKELQRIDGIGKVKAAQISCILELANRIAQIRKPLPQRLDRPDLIADYFMADMSKYETESTVVLYLDNRCRLLHSELLFVGSLSSCVANPREILRKALQYDAASFILLHNHPSGDPTPSSVDLNLTKKLEKAAQYIGVPLMDHIIIGDYQYISLRERGLMGQN